MFEGEVWRGTADELFELDCSDLEADCKKHDRCLRCATEDGTYAIVRLPEQDTWEKIGRHVAAAEHNCFASNCKTCVLGETRWDGACAAGRARRLVEKQDEQASSDNQ